MAAKKERRRKPKLVKRKKAVDAVAAAAGLSVRRKEPGKRVLVGCVPFRWSGGHWQVCGWWVSQQMHRNPRNEVDGPIERRVHKELATVGYDCRGDCGWVNCFAVT